MNSVRQRPRVALPSAHPAVLERRMSDLLTTGAMALISTVLALAVTIGLPEARLPVALAAIAALIGVSTLVVCSRLEITGTLVLVYLLLIDGPVKMLTGSREATAAIPDLLILAVTVGALMRMLVQKQRIKLPPLSGWVIVWTVLVVANAFNPKTQGLLAVLGGFYQQLQWVPLFFLGFVLMRSTHRFRQLFIIVGVAATASGAVAAYQTELTPAQLASWGPGYHALIKPEKGKGTGRVYFSEGEARVRPPGLGSEAGGSGGIGHVALPMCLALFAITRRKKRWIAALLCLGSIMAVIVGLGRLQLIGAGLGVVAFVGLSMLSGRQVTRAMGAVLAVVVLAIPAGAILVSSLRNGTFKRYESINTSSSTTLHKEGAWSKIPEYVEASPLGYGLGNSGVFAGRYGTNQNLLEGHGLTSETQYNVLVKELGLPGLILWPVTSFAISLLILRRIRRIRDGDLAICLAGMLAPFIALPIEGTSGFLGGSLAGGGYFWFAIGVTAYWLAGHRSEPSSSVVERGDAAPVPA
jgi:hypothetical protein